MYNFSNVKNVIEDQYKVKYYIGFCTLTSLNIFPKELILYILELQRHELYRQLMLIDHDQAIYLLTYLCFITGQAKFSYEPYKFFPRHHPLRTFIDNYIDFFEISLGRRVWHEDLIYSLISEISSIKNIDELINEVLLNQAYIIKKINKNIRLFQLKYINLYLMNKFKHG